MKSENPKFTINPVGEDSEVQESDARVRRVQERLEQVERRLSDLYERRRERLSVRKEAAAQAILDGAEHPETIAVEVREVEVAIAAAVGERDLLRRAVGMGSRDLLGARERAARTIKQTFAEQHGPALFERWRESVEEGIEVAKLFESVAATVRAAGLGLYLHPPRIKADARALSFFVEAGWVDRERAEALRREWLASGAAVPLLRVDGKTVTPIGPPPQDRSPDAERRRMLQRRGLMAKGA